MAKVSVIGAGSWGTALALLLSKNGHDVTMWSILEDEIRMLDKEREHKSKLPGVKLPDTMKFTTDLKEAVEGKDFLVLAVPSTFTRGTAKNMCPYVAEGQIIVDVAKGIEEATLMTLSQQIEDEIPQADVAVLSGPSHAEEVGRGLPTTVVVGAKTEKTAEYLQQMFASEVFRVYTSPDMLGMELGGSLKNVIALAAGIADGMGYGDNTKAALITRGIAEIARLGVKMGGAVETFSGLTGIGDLIVTCASVHSRNRKAGYLMGQGKSMQEAMDEVQMVVEGVYSAKAAVKLGEKYGVSLPIINKVSEVLFDGKDPKEAVNELMLRDNKAEHTALPWEKKKKLEEKRDKELAAAKSKANKKAMKIEIAQAIASTAMSAINAYASAAAIPTIGWTLAPIAAGMATAAGMIQLAAIKKQHQAEAAGYYEGGYTGGNRYRKEAGVVHEGEFVANHNAVNNSSIRPALDLIDRAQRSNTVGSLTADDITRSLGQGSSTVVAPVVNVNNDNTEVRQSLDGVNAAVSRLTQTLDDGIEVEVPISGRRGLHRRLQDYQRILNNK